MAELFWWIFAAISLLGAVGMVSGKNPIASLLFLVLTLFSLAAVYVILGAHFIGAIQVIVYAGAIMVLFLFVIMLLNLGHDYRSDLRSVGWRIGGGIVAAVFTGILGYALWRAFAEPEALVDAGGGLAIETAVQELNAVGAIAFPLFREFVVPFEITSVLLLVAVIGAVVLAKRRV